MKKFFIAAIALMMCTTGAMALDNEPEEGFTYMGLFGMNVSKLQNSDYSAKAGAMMGARIDYMLPSAHGTYVTAGLDWTMKGGKMSVPDDLVIMNADGSQTAFSGDHKYALHYFEIPIRVGFRYNIIEELGIYGEIGPYFAVGVGGKHKCSIGDGNAKNEAEDYDTYKAFKNRTDLERPTFQRWDAGIGFRVGAEYNQHYNLMLGCDWGLADIYRNNLRTAYYEATSALGEPQDLPKVHNFNFSITLGYRF